MTRTIVSSTFISLDGVMQGPGRPDEDTSGGFTKGGWVAGFGDEVVGEAVGDLFTAPFDLLLGRRTYDIFAAYWPKQRDNPEAGNREISRKFDEATKYVATHDPSTLGWKTSHALGDDIVAALRRIKQASGPRLLVQGSSELLHTLLANELVDELRLITFPIVLGKGKRLWTDASAPRAFDVSQSKVSAKGVVVATYTRAGEVKTGSF